MPSSPSWMLKGEGGEDPIKDGGEAPLETDEMRVGVGEESEGEGIFDGRRDGGGGEWMMWFERPVVPLVRAGTLGTETEQDGIGHWKGKYPR